MNLLVTDKCTNHCPYCFASTEMGKTQMLNHLSRENTEKVLEFIRNGEPNFSINIIGGEPFLYNDLGYLLERLTSEPNFKDAVIFTGGIFKTEKLNELKPYSKKISFLFNLNEKDVYKNEKEYQLVLTNLQKGLELGIHTNIGVNIYRTDFNFQEILDVCYDFGIEQLRWTVACPQINPSPDVKVLYPSDYPIVSKRIMQFLEKAFEMKISTYLDCPVPKCFFTTEELGRISLIQPHVVSAIHTCAPVVDVAPDLSVIRCFAFSEIERKKITDFKNFDDAIKYFERNIDEIYAKPQLYAKCNDCEFAINRTCFGGCMVNTPNAIGKIEKVEFKLKEAFEAIQKGNFELSENILLSINRKDASVAFLTAHSFYQKGDIKNAKRWALITINRSKTDDFRLKAKNLLENISI